jgi:hypothetical protein
MKVKVNDRVVARYTEECDEHIATVVSVSDDGGSTLVKLRFLEGPHTGWECIQSIRHINIIRAEY